MLDNDRVAPEFDHCVWADHSVALVVREDCSLSDRRRKFLIFPSWND